MVECDPGRPCQRRGDRDLSIHKGGKAMALEVRRIVTGHDSQGKAVVATDERLAGTGAAGRAGISRVDVWSTDKMPIDNSDAAAELQRKGFVVRHHYVGSGQRS